MRRRFRHDALLILLICSWVPVAIAAALILVQVSQSHARRLDQAKIALNGELLGIEAAAEILLASRELNDFMTVDESVRLMTGNLLYGRAASLKKKAPAISSFEIVDNASGTIFSFPAPRRKTYSLDGANSYGFSLIDQNTLRYYRPLEYDDQEFPKPAATLKGFLVLEIDLSSWRNSLGGAANINKISSQPSLAGIDLEFTDDGAGSPWQYVPHLLVLVVVLVLATMVGLYLMRAWIVTPVTQLTRYVGQQMGRAPGDTQHHELTVLKESFETYVRYEGELKAKLLQQSTLAAIGRTTQMLAHDVRKPFAMLKSLLHLIRGAKNRTDVDTMTGRFIPEIDKAMLSVEGLIRDIMEVGSNKKPNQEVVHLSSLIQSSLYDTFRTHPRRDIKLRYAFNHRHALYVDPPKTSRVFANISSNAIEAIDGAGELWFETRELGNRSPPMVEIVIGNSHSFIPEDRREQIFEAFFTQGKRGGTGLGLAIVKKLIVDHGGEISCRSSLDRGTEFVFTLPVADVLSDNVAHELPASSDQIIGEIQNVEPNREEASSIQADEAKLVERIVEMAKQTEQRIAVLVADDEPLYRRMLESHAGEPALKPHVQLMFADSAEQALELAADSRFDVIIMDVNFGKDRLDGFDAVQRLRADGSQAYICVHSNHGILAYQSRAIESGANLFMLKPMTRTHLLTLIYSTIQERAPSSHGLKRIK